MVWCPFVFPSFHACVDLRPPLILTPASLLPQQSGLLSPSLETESTRTISIYFILAAAFQLFSLRVFNLIYPLADEPVFNDAIKGLAVLCCTAVLLMGIRHLVRDSRFAVCAHS